MQTEIHHEHFDVVLNVIARLSSISHCLLRQVKVTPLYHLNQGDACFVHTITLTEV